MIYIANCTKQVFRLAYRQKGSMRVWVRDIPSGQQTQVDEGTMPAGWMQGFIEHLERFGARNRKQINTNINDFDGLLYSFDAPIKAEVISTAHDTIVEKQEKRSASEASKGALAYDSASKVKGRRMAKSSEVEIEQIVPGDAKPTGREVNFSVAVDSVNINTDKLPVIR